MTGRDDSEGLGIDDGGSMRIVLPLVIVLGVALMIEAQMGIVVTNEVQEESAEWCADHDGELLISTSVFGSEYRCSLPNGTVVNPVEKVLKNARGAS